MKHILLFTLALPLLSAAQSKGYASLSGGLSFKDETKSVFNLSAGFMPDGSTVGFGAGVGLINYGNPYIPITAEASFFGKPDKISPLVIGKAGYGVYSGPNNTRGGFTASVNGGISVPAGKTKALLMLGYSSYSFNMNLVKTRESRVSLCLGLKI